MTEAQFWEATPKKIIALYKVYKVHKGIEDESALATIDDILF